MFDSRDWCKIISKTYNLKLVKFFYKKKSPIYGIEKTDQKQNSIIHFSPFGDYCDQNYLKKNLKPVSKKKDNYSYRLKFISKKKITLKNYNLDGYVHILQLKNYEDWINGKKIRYSFKRYLKPKYIKDLNVKISYKKKDLDSFYDLYEKYRFSKFKKIAQPKSFFDNIFNTYIQKKRGFIISAYKKKKLLSSMIYICNYKDKKSYYKFGCSKISNKYKSNNFLIQEAIKFLTKKKIKTICFGYSDLNNEGLIKFKRNIGTDEYLRYSYGSRKSLESKKINKLNKKIIKSKFNKLNPLKNEYSEFLQ